MIRGIRRRSTFVRLRREGRRVRRRGLAVVFLPTAPEPTEVAFAISRRAGSAVRRNRCRRRLRALFDARERTGVLPRGAYLVSVAPELIDAPQRELAVALDEILAGLPVEGAPRDHRGRSADRVDAAAAHARSACASLPRFVVP